MVTLSAEIERVPAVLKIEAGLDAEEVMLRSPVIVRLNALAQAICPDPLGPPKTEVSLITVAVMFPAVEERIAASSTTTRLRPAFNVKTSLALAVVDCIVAFSVTMISVPDVTVKAPAELETSALPPLGKPIARTAPAVAVMEEGPAPQEIDAPEPPATCSAITPTSRAAVMSIVPSVEICAGPFAITSTLLPEVIVIEPVPELLTAELITMSFVFNVVIERPAAVLSPIPPVISMLPLVVWIEKALGDE